MIPAAMAAALKSYQDFLDRNSDEAAGDFKDRHTACKAALAHIELLVKLAGIIGDLENTPEDKNKINDLIAKAMDELREKDI